MVQTGCTGLEFYVASQTIDRRCHGYDDNQSAGAVVENIDRDNDRRPMKRGFMTDGLTQINEIDLASPDQADTSHS